MTFDGNSTAVIATAAAVVGVLLILVFGKPIRSLLEKLRMSRAIRRLGAESMSNLIITDGLDGHVFIEHLVLTPAHILVVSVRRYSGAIFAAENMDMWAQVTSNGSYKFPNPLHEIEAATLAVKSHLPGVAVEGVILFGRESTFPKGKPKGVVHISEIGKDHNPGGPSEVPKAIKKAWSRLLDLKASA